MSRITARKHDPASTIQGIGIPDSKLCRQITELVRDTESDLLFNHSSRVYSFAALTGLRRNLRFDRELLYAGAMFHAMGLTPRHSSRTERFEVDGANVARDFLKAHNIAQGDIDLVWTAIALHTTPGGRGLSAHPSFQGGHHPDLLRWHQAQARHDVRQRQGRRPRRQGPQLPARQFLHCDPGIALDGLSKASADLANGRIGKMCARNMPPASRPTSFHFDARNAAVSRTTGSAVFGARPT
jgi:hypothetical protein